jgi:hypothetical protein
MIRFGRIVAPVITRRSLLSTIQSTNLLGNNRENYFAHLIQGEDALDLICFPKDHLIVSPEWDDASREKTFRFPGEELICYDITRYRMILRLSPIVHSNSSTLSLDDILIAAFWFILHARPMIGCHSMTFFSRLSTRDRHAFNSIIGIDHLIDMSGHLSIRICGSDSWHEELDLI